MLHLKAAQSDWALSVDTLGAWSLLPQACPPQFLGCCFQSDIDTESLTVRGPPSVTSRAAEDQ